MKKNDIAPALLIIALLFSSTCMAECTHVYTIGAYDQAFKQHQKVSKLGPLSASEVPPTLPKTFLEKNGSYAGGEAFRTISSACQALNYQAKVGILPNNEAWHIYKLDADWYADTYKLRANDVRLKRTVNVLKLVRKDCY